MPILQASNGTYVVSTASSTAAQPLPTPRTDVQAGIYQLFEQAALLCARPHRQKRPEVGPHEEAGVRRQAGNAEARQAVHDMAVRRGQAL